MIMIMMMMTNHLLNWNFFLSFSCCTENRDVPHAIGRGMNISMAELSEVRASIVLLINFARLLSIAPCPIYVSY